MTRAIETFNILMAKLPKNTPTAVMPGLPKVVYDDSHLRAVDEAGRGRLPDLKEGRPCQPVPASASGLYKKRTVEEDGKRIDQAFDEIFYRAHVNQVGVAGSAMARFLGASDARSAGQVRLALRDAVAL